VVRLFLLIAIFFAVEAAGQSYPSRPLRMVVGFAPGGAADFVARTLQPSFSRALGQSVVIENRPGAGSSIAAEYVARSAPDGYTLLIASPSSILVNPRLTPKAGFQPLKDLAPISKVSASPLVAAVHRSLGIATLKEMIAYLKQHPGKVNFASSGNGAAPHLAAVLFMRLAGVDMVHVPYNGGAPAVQSLVAGDTQFYFATPPSVLPLVHAGRLRALAVTSRERTALVPGVPGMAEAGLPDYQLSFWYGFFAPAATPPDIIARLYEATQASLKSPESGKALAREGTETSGSRSPSDFAAFLAEDDKLWARLIRDSGAKAD